MSSTTRTGPLHSSLSKALPQQGGGETHNPFLFSGVSKPSPAETISQSGGGGGIEVGGWRSKDHIPTSQCIALSIMRCFDCIKKLNTMVDQFSFW